MQSKKPLSLLPPPLRDLLLCLTGAAALVVPALFSPLMGQDPAVGDTAYYDYEYSDEDYIDDEYVDDEYIEEYYDEETLEDDTSYYEDDEYYGDEYGDESYDVYLEDEEYLDDEYFYDEEYDDVTGAEVLELAGEADTTVTLEDIASLGEEEELGFKLGYNLKLSVISPWQVVPELRTWYSYIDGRLSLSLPKTTKLGPVEFSYGVEVALFNFENTFPAGGDFSGVAISGLVQTWVNSFLVTAGAGVYDLKPAGSLGVSYTPPFLQFINLESRFNYVDKATVHGAAYWLDVGGSLNFRF